MENNKFKTYQILHKKLASAFFEDDKNVSNLTDTLIKQKLDAPGVLNTITRPFKQLYIDNSSIKENIHKGLKNLGPEFINIQKEYAIHNLADRLSKLEPVETLKYFGSMFNSMDQKNPSYFTKYNTNFLNSYLGKDLFSKFLPDGYTKDSFETALSEGKFNTKEQASQFLASLKRKLTPVNYRPNLLYTLYKFILSYLGNSNFTDKKIYTALDSFSKNKINPTSMDHLNKHASSFEAADAKRVQEMRSNPTFRSSMGVAAAGNMGVNPNKIDAVEGPGMNNDGSGADWLNARDDMNATGSILEGHLSNYEARTGHGSRAFFNSLTDLLKKGDYDKATSLWHSGKQRRYFSPSQSAFYDKLGPNYKFNESNASSFLDQYPR